MSYYIICTLDIKKVKLWLLSEFFENFRDYIKRWFPLFKFKYIHKYVS